MNLQTSLQTADSSNDTAVQGGDGKIRCLNAEPEVPKCEVRLLTGNIIILPHTYLGGEQKKRKNIFRE